MTNEENYIEKIFEHYQEKSKNFQRSFSILLGAALIFFFIIFLPYSSLLGKNYQLGQSLNETENYIDAYQKSQDGILKFNNLTLNTPQNVFIFLEFIIHQGDKNSKNLCKGKNNNYFLFQTNTKNLSNDIESSFKDQITNRTTHCQDRNSISFEDNGTNTANIYSNERNIKIEKLLFFPYYSYPNDEITNAQFLEHNSIILLPYFGCGIILTEVYLKCNYGEKIDYIYYEWHKNVTHYITSPLSIFGSKSEILANIVPNLNQELSNLSNTYKKTARDTINDALKQNTSQGSILYEQDLQSLIDRLKEVNNNFKKNTLRELNTTLEEGINKTEERKDQLNNEKNDILSKQKEIANRINQTESPIGKIPIGINESVALFPLVLAVGFSISAYLLYETIRLRAEYHRLTNPLYSKNKSDVSNVAPLWIDPIKLRSKKYLHKQEALAKLVVFFLPLTIFVISCFLISQNYKFMNSEDFENIFPYEKELYQTVYTGVYIFSLILICYVTIILIIQLHKYSPT